MEQKNNLTEEIKEKVENETIEVNPLEDAFKAIAQVMVPDGAD